MAKRRKPHRERDGNECFGDQWSEVKSQLTTLCRNVVMASASIEAAPDEILRMVIEPSAYKALKEGYRYTERPWSGDVCTIPLRKYDHVSFTFMTNEEEWPILQPAAAFMEWNNSPSTEKFLLRCDKIVGIVQRFSVVLSVLKYFHTYGTLAAVRNYLPQAMPLAKGLHWPAEGAKYKVPVSIGSMVGRIRDATLTLGTAMMAPEAGSSFSLKSHLSFTTDWSFAHPDFGKMPYLEVDIPVITNRAEIEETS